MALQRPGFWIASLAAACFVASLGVAQETGKKPAGDSFFGLTTIHKLHLDFSAAEWAKMQPPAKGGFPGFGPKQPAPPKEVPKEGAKNADVHKSGGAFGTEYPWVHADLAADGTTIKNVGVRFKGNFTYVASAQILRRPLKIELDHFDDDAPRLHGQRKLNLANGITDPARLREAVAFSVYRAAGVPAPRTAYAELTLSVPGKYDKEYVGLYTIVEQVDKAFLKAHFKNAKGLLLKPENLRGGIEYLGDDWPRYEDKYRPKTEATREQEQRLIAFARLIHKADDAQFRKEIAGFLDIDTFLRFMAADALMANLDSYLGFGHNFYLYLRPDTNRFVFMPWDLDLSMGMWPVGGPPEKQIDLSLEHPHIGQNKLIDRLFTMKEVKEKYDATLKELTATCFTKEKLLKEIDLIEAATKDSLARERTAAAARKETAKGGAFSAIVAQGPPLRTFIEKRTESALAQLAGQRKGYVAAGMGFGPPGGGFPGGGPKGPPGGFGPGNFLAKLLLASANSDKNGRLTRDEATAAAKTFFKTADKDNAGTLNEAQIAAAIDSLLPRPKGVPAPPPGFSLGNMMAGSILKRADAKKTGTTSLADFTAAVDAAFRELDKNNNGYLDEAAIATGLNSLITPPGPPRLDAPKR